MKDIYYFILDLLRQMWRFRWWSMTAMWALGLLGGIGVLALPNVYEAKAQFYIDANSRLRDVVSQLGMSPGVSSRVFLVSQAMIGRPQIERVVSEVGLDVDAGDEEERQSIVSEVMEKLKLESGRGEEAQNLFTITYRNTSRDDAIAVVDKTLTGFRDHVLKAKVSDTSRAGDFLVSQLDYYRSLLSETEEKLEAFKRSNPGFVVSETGGGVFEQMQAARSEVGRLERARRVEENKREELRRQLSKVDPYAPPSEQAQTELNSLIPGARTRSMISQLESQRGQLLLSFTAEHPDVINIDQQIVILRKQLDEELQMDVADRGVDGARRASNPVYIQIQLNLSQSNLVISELDSQLADARGNADGLEKRLSSAPEIERHYLELTRDYDKWRGLYDQVLMQAEKERIGRVGDEQDVVTFNIIEPPAADIEPVSPPRFILLLAVLVLSAGVGVLVAFVLDQLNPAFSSESQLAKMQIPIAGSVSMFVTPELTSRRQTDLRRFLVGVFGFLLLYTGIIIGMEPITLLLEGMRD
jgi:polysaccharide chain length determinant protein (PEP-CTERM system associated)